MSLSPVFSMILLWTLAVLITADPLCDPVTQYLHNGECCLLCKPGTSMVSMGECRHPACKDCEENEYTDEYNKEQMCARQPYCDPNSNFVWPESTSRTKRHQCLCKQGFHCSSSSCTTCVPHTECERGYGATTVGDQTHDTVCGPCPNDTFSDERSWDGRCKKKTTCESGTKPKGGSSESDRECVPDPTPATQKANHVGLIIGLLVAAGVAAGVGFLIYKRRCKGQTQYGLQKVPIETVAADYDNRPDEETGNLVITTPTDDRELLRMPSQETAYPNGPTEETEDDGVRTANGDLLSQDGKDHVISQQETMAIY